MTRNAIFYLVIFVLSWACLFSTKNLRAETSERMLKQSNLISFKCYESSDSTNNDALIRKIILEKKHKSSLYHVHMYTKNGADDFFGKSKKQDNMSCNFENSDVNNFSAVCYNTKYTLSIHSDKTKNQVEYTDAFLRKGNEIEMGLRFYHRNEKEPCEVFWD